jgi:hypothetical protein
MVFFFADAKKPGHPDYFDCIEYGKITLMLMRLTFTVTTPGKNFAV